MDEVGAVAAVADDVQPAFLRGHQDQALGAEGGHDLVGDPFGHVADARGLGESGRQVCHEVQGRRAYRFVR